MTLVVDRIEGDWVILAPDDGLAPFAVPLRLLSPSCKEGDVLHFSVVPDPTETRRRRSALAARLEDLVGDEPPGGDFSL